MLAFTQLGSGCLVNNDNKILRDKNVLFTVKSVFITFQYYY